MSFRRRGEVLNSPSIQGGSNPRVGGPQAVPQRGVLPNRPGTHRAIPGQQRVAVPNPLNPVKIGPQHIQKPPESTSDQYAHRIGVMPSLVTSEPTVSTGCSDLDKVLLHKGLPIGKSILVEETGSTDFASVLVKCFASQGIIHNRISGDQKQSHVIVLGLPHSWANELPGLYKGSTKEQKKAKIESNESKISVDNLADSTSARNENNMKIAWRYGLSKNNETSKVTEEENNKNYQHQFDITSRLIPSPSQHEISFVPVSNVHNFSVIIAQLDEIIRRQIKQSPSIRIRIAIPNFLTPLLYHPSCSSPTFIFPFISSLRTLLRNYSNNLVLMTSISSDLYPSESLIGACLLSLFDSVVKLQPFNEEMTQLIEKAYKSEPSKIQHGLLHVLKIPTLSDRGMMMVRQSEYAFKNGRKKFEIEEWSIPVEDDANENDAQTTKSVEF
ncbi:Piso0_005729 [Millerozyma farinosa CBS 7064]|uniref:Elongator complex protein 4 n=1 Tax=Pichia sorbitophila (strain ATCC MYA-4447 / BCRC 22081 / CBS 7064 / NBRC 10061 / NRRL Y-12695) TaxID=559304 RepID=G8Y2R9_PICSO|nr:Piso0_005729 [Millerozyma farinosa CBS 7064]